MRAQLVIGVAFLSLCAYSSAEDPLAELQRSHIEANVPLKERFGSLLHRDLLAHFRNGITPKASKVDYQLLREAPTQSGVAYPKYYLWVRILSGSSVLAEGAVRVAAMNRNRFEVTQFLSREEVRANPSRVGAVFPALLVERVLALAGAE